MSRTCSRAVLRLAEQPLSCQIIRYKLIIMMLGIDLLGGRGGTLYYKARGL